MWLKVWRIPFSLQKFRLWLFDVDVARARAIKTGGGWRGGKLWPIIAGGPPGWEVWLLSGRDKDQLQLPNRSSTGGVGIIVAVVDVVVDVGVVTTSRKSFPLPIGLSM